jgi:DNA-binding transcriptional LysR family regulator
MRFVQQGEMRENSVPVMPEILLPVCNPRYRDMARTDEWHAHGDTVIVMDDEERGWHTRFAAFRNETRHASGVLSFNDYAIVLQAALLGQGIALGWVSVVMHWLAQHALVPAEDELLVTNRMCCLSWAPGKSLRPIVAEVREWLIAEMRADLAAVDTVYPALGLGAAVKKGLASWS